MSAAIFRPKWGGVPPLLALPNLDSEAGALALSLFSYNTGSVYGVNVCGSGTLGTSSGESSVVETKWGPGVRVNGNTVLDRASCGRPFGSEPGANDCTFIAFHREDDFTSAYSVLSKWNTGADIPSCDWFLGGTSGMNVNISFSVASGSTSYEASLSGGTVNGDTYMYVGRRRGTYLDIHRLNYGASGRYLLSHNFASQSSGPSGAINANSARNVRWGSIDVGASLNNDITCFYAGFLGGFLSDSGLWELAKEPMSIFAPPRRRLYFGDAVAASFQAAWARRANTVIAPGAGYAA